MNCSICFMLFLKGDWVHISHQLFFNSNSWLVCCRRSNKSWRRWCSGPVGTRLQDSWLTSKRREGWWNRFFYRILWCWLMGSTSWLIAIIVREIERWRKLLIVVVTIVFLRQLVLSILRSYFNSITKELKKSILWSRTDSEKKPKNNLLIVLILWVIASNDMGSWIHGILSWFCITAVFWTIGITSLLWVGY